ncbi:MAG: AI-2E family transporter [Clostridia bacterium]|nr:AI-2E family transporter [Clostridia bacterium]
MKRFPKAELKNTFIIITFTVLLLFAAFNIKLLWGVVWKALSWLSPVLAGLAIAYVLNILMRVFEDRVFAFMKRSKRKFVRNMLRPLSLVLTIIVFLGLITVFIAVIWPDLEETILSLSSKLPSYFNELKAWGLDMLSRFHFDTEWLENYTVDWKLISNTVLSLFDSDSASSIIGGATSVVGSITGGVINTIFSFVIAIYFLAQKERICKFCGRMFRAFLPEKASARLFHFTDICNTVFSNFIRGQCAEAVIFGVLCYIGMLIFRFPYAGIISIVIGCTALVPIIGALIGEIFGAILILTVSPIKALLFLVFVLVLQQLEGSLIYPKVVGSSIGLPGILVFSAVIIGGNIGGILYSLLSVPTCAVIYILIREQMEKRAKAKEIAAETAPPDPPVREEKTEEKTTEKA